MLAIGAKVKEKIFHIVLLLLLLVLNAASYAMLIYFQNHPGRSRFLGLSGDERLIFGFVFGSVVVPMALLGLQAIASMSLPSKKRFLTCYVLSGTLLLPVGLLLISYMTAGTNFADILTRPRAGRVALFLLAVPLCGALAYEMRLHNRILKSVSSSNLVLSFIVFSVGDSLLWYFVYQNAYKLAPSDFLVVVNGLLFYAIALAFIAFVGKRPAALVAFILCCSLFYSAMFLKMKYLHSPLCQLDLGLIREFIWAAPESLGKWNLLGSLGLLVCAGLIFLKVFFKTNGYLPRRKRTLYAGLAISILTIASASGRLRKNSASEYSEGYRWALSGSAVYIMNELGRHYQDVEPLGYSRELAQQLERENTPEVSRDLNIELPNVILVLVESMIDTADLEIPITPEPQPFLRSLTTRGIVNRSVVPKELYGSAITEFEVLTGMEANAFNRIPYSLLSGRAIPSLFKELSVFGYETHVVMTDPRSIFNRETAYLSLGVSNIHWLFDELKPIDKAEVNNNPTHRGYDLDALLFDRVTQIIRSSERPCFVFAFTCATHHPYGSKSPSKWLASDLGDQEKNEIGGYCDEISQLDLELVEFSDELNSVHEPTLTLVTGDHMPPLTVRTGPYSDNSSGDVFAKRKTPLFVLESGGFKSKSNLPDLMSTNMIPWFIFDAVDLPSASAFSVVARRAYRTSKIVSGSNTPPEDDKFVTDYRVLQHYLFYNGDFVFRD